MKLTLRNVGKRYARRTVLRDCSCTFATGKTHVLTGSNGCGKSTLLRICALLEEPDFGEVRYLSPEGTELRKDLSLMRRMTLVLPRLGLFNASVLHNAGYGLALRGVKKKIRFDKALDCLAFVGLEKKKEQNALSLSSGEMQRLAIARALAIDPELLFLDEPTASIDQENTEIVESIIGAMKEDRRTTVILTTHDRAQAERLADRLLVLTEGTIAYKEKAL